MGLYPSKPKGEVRGLSWPRAPTLRANRGHRQQELAQLLGTEVRCRKVQITAVNRVSRRLLPTRKKPSLLRSDGWENSVGLNF